MTIARAKEILMHKTAGGKKLPDDELLSEMFLEAMLYVASKCVPSELVRYNESEDTVFRTIDDGFFICIPDKPNFTNPKEHVMIDESLTYAVINYVAFLLNDGEVLYKQLANEIIGDFIANEDKRAKVRA